MLVPCSMQVLLIICKEAESWCMTIKFLNTDSSQSDSETIDSSPVRSCHLCGEVVMVSDIPLVLCGIS